MCGLAGFILGQKTKFNDLNDINNQMISQIAHRGPDALDSWCDEPSRVGLSHVRLAIQDLSIAGSQPMHSKSRRFIIVFNGEIYNHLILRNQLQKGSLNQQKWRGTSDTETLLACIEAWGLNKTLNMCVGMFAFALWDTHEKFLYLARDRFGEKPLYYGVCNDNLVFGSELKAIKSFPGFNQPISKIALQNFIHLSYIPAPYSIYEDIYKLEPGHFLKIDADNFINTLSDKVSYWSIDERMTSCLNDPYLNEQEGLDDLEQKITNAVSDQLISDVPLGAFLSGGVDSSLIASIMQKENMAKVKTFTIGFEESDYDESLHAKAVADYLGTEHHELNVSSQDALNLIPSLPSMYDEPFADSSQIPTYFVCNSAKKHVTVSLSGDGADELFGGYNRYTWGPKIWGHLSLLPHSARDALMNFFTILSPETLNSFFRFTGITRPGEKLHKLSYALKGCNSIEDLYVNLISQWSDQNLIKGLRPMLSSSDRIKLFNMPFNKKINEDSLQMMFRDSKMYLPDDILCKVDRAAMAISLETRAPFLDHRVDTFLNL